ncbi:MAG: UDP-N-acetylmuramate--L-alanine ligase [Anaerolineae bacterium]|nr:UDP-N-acetylmuramate--L-alanine ligase [Thermoflexales bacterium]MDW8406691.1 UDP-N-acetylmuramate--L-alanine ligase [Anaerolineae bacterium]
MNVHIMGIGGAGMSAIARLMKARGFNVTGDDRVHSAVLEALNAEGIPAFVGHDPAHLYGIDAVAPSSAIPRDEPELVAARERGIPIWHRGDVLNMLMQGTDNALGVGIAVAGTHGKSTTTAMIATILMDAGFDPSFIIGATPANLGVNARAGAGQAFVVEADEYDRTFLRLYPRIAVITNVEFDHPDTYRNLDDIIEAFALFAGNVPADGALIACADDPGTERVLKRVAAGPHPPAVIDYGLHRGMWRASNVRANPLGGVDFDYDGPRGLGGRVSLRVPGEHNALNALAALAVAEAVGAPLEEAVKSLGGYLGAGRRFELRGERRGVRVFDDYAHHPTEIRATLRAARQRFPVARIWAIWQPHTYSRTIALMDQFADSFGDADRVLVLPIYAARERAEDFGFAANALNPIELARRLKHRHAHSAASFGDALGLLISQISGGDVVITLSAGDGNLVGERLLEMLG